MRRRLVPGVLLALLLPGAAQAAHFDQLPPASSTVGQPITFSLGTDGLSVSSGVAYKLSGESAWHRCLAPGQITITPPVGGYVLAIADDTNRSFFDANLPASTTPECGETTAPRNATLSYATFVVNAAPRPLAPPAIDTCGPALAKVDRLHNRAEILLIRYEHRRTKARRRAWAKAHDAYAKAWRAYRKRC